MSLWLRLALAILALAYFVWPLDVIPDVAVGLGYIDDVLVVALLLFPGLFKMIKKLFRW